MCVFVFPCPDWCSCASRRIEYCQTADEFYSTMGCLTQEMLEHSLVDSAELMQVPTTAQESVEPSGTGQPSLIYFQ